MKKDKKKTWMRFRHRVVRNLAYAVLYPYSRWKYGITIEPFLEQNGRQYLILLNHQTPFDQFFVGMAFKGPVYYMATEDIFSLGWVSDVIRYVIAPIPIKKQTTDIQAVMNCLRIAKEGGTICIAPEGNRTYSGRTEYMNPAIAGLAKKMQLPIALYRLEGGYGVQPRWSDCVRKGKMRGYVSQVIEPEEYARMSNDELMDVIRSGLAVNENCLSGHFVSEHSAEYLERAIYVCPYCGLAHLESNEDIIECLDCGMKVRYLPTKELEGVGFTFPFRFVGDWYDYQQDFINRLDLNVFDGTPAYTDNAMLSEVIVYKKKQLLRKNARFALYGNRIVIDEHAQDALVLPFDQIHAISVLGRNKLNIYHKKTVYQVKGSKRFNALKYVNFYYRYKNMTKGDCNGKFLGL